MSIIASQAPEEFLGRIQIMWLQIMLIWSETWQQIREGIKKYETCSIASGSSGNCIYVGSDQTHLLVDVGISGKRVEQGLNELELTGRDIDGVLITHEHSDHIKGLGVLARKYQIPVYTTGGNGGFVQNEPWENAGRYFS